MQGVKLVKCPDVRSVEPVKVSSLNKLHLDKLLVCEPINCEFGFLPGAVLSPEEQHVQTAKSFEYNTVFSANQAVSVVQLRLLIVNNFTVRELIKSTIRLFVFRVKLQGSSVGLLVFGVDDRNVGSSEYGRQADPSLNVERILDRQHLRLELIVEEGVVVSNSDY